MSENEEQRDNGITNLGDITFINIIGQIEGHTVLPTTDKSTKYEHLLPKLVEFARDKKSKGLFLILNTVGGDVEAGLAIAEMISGIDKPSVSLVLGGGHSIGVPLAVSAGYSFIAPSATMTVHPIRMNGLVIGAEQTYDYFEKMQKRITDFVVRHSKISEKDFKNTVLATSEMANDVGTILFGNEAVKLGLIDEVGSVSKALSKLDEMINKKI